MMIIPIQDINILHWNGFYKDDNDIKYKLFSELSLNKIYKPNWLDIIICYTDRNKALLANQLELSNISYINPIVKTNNFIKAYKPIYYYGALKECKNEYTIIMDAYDVVIINFNDIIEKLSIYNRQLIYNAQCYDFPPINLEYDVGCPNNTYNKINSGVVFGKTKDLKEFYKGFSEYTKNNINENEYETLFEQYHLQRYLHYKLNNISVGIDYKLLSLIQCFNMSLYKDENNNIFINDENAG